MEEKRKKDRLMKGNCKKERQERLDWRVGASGECASAVYDDGALMVHAVGYSLPAGN